MAIKVHLVGFQRDCSYYESTILSSITSSERDIVLVGGGKYDLLIYNFDERYWQGDDFYVQKIKKSLNVHQTKALVISSENSGELGHLPTFVDSDPSYLNYGKINYSHKCKIFSKNTPLYS